MVTGFIRVLKTIEFQESDFKALKVLEFCFRSLKVLDFLSNKIEVRHTSCNKFHDQLVEKTIEETKDKNPETIEVRVIKNEWN